MPINLKMPALSPTMEEGTLAKWLVKEGDTVASGDLLAEIETDKATMEFEAVDEGVIARIVIPEGTDNVKVGEIIAIMAAEGEDMAAAAAPVSGTDASPHEASASVAAPVAETKAAIAVPAPASTPDGGRVKASPLAKRIAAAKGIDLASITGTGPSGRIVKADVADLASGTARTASATGSAIDAPVATTSAPAMPAPTPAPATAPFTTDIPHEEAKLSNMRKTIARRLTEAKQTIPHIYLTLDIQLDKLLKLRGELNKALESQGVKLSVNDMLIKALARALIQVPKCNVSFAGNTLISYSRADVSVAVSTPAGLITPIITGADTKAVGAISSEMKELAGRAKEGKLQPHEYQGGTASLSNMGMFGIKHFEAVINPPQGMIMAIGAGEKRPHVIDDALGIATLMSATGSFDHRAIDGADGAQLMAAFKELCENPLGMLA